jgi:hypothetical protein
VKVTVFETDPVTYRGIFTVLKEVMETLQVDN